MRGDTRESFFSSISRTKGAYALAEADERRRLELDALIARTKDESVATQQRARAAARKGRERKRRGPTRRYGARVATFSTGGYGDKGGGI